MRDAAGRSVRRLNSPEHITLWHIPILWNNAASVPLQHGNFCGLL